MLVNYLSNWFPMFNTFVGCGVANGCSSLDDDCWQETAPSCALESKLFFLVEVQSMSLWAISRFLPSKKEKYIWFICLEFMTYLKGWNVNRDPIWFSTWFKQMPPRARSAREPSSRAKGPGAVLVSTSVSRSGIAWIVC